MPISADQWRAVTGLNNVRRPRQVGIKPRYMQQEPCGDNEKLCHHPEPDTNKDTTGGGARSKRSRIKKGSRRKDRSRRPERDKFQDDSTISIRTILWPSLLALCLAVIVPSLNLTVCGANVNDILITPGAAAVIGDDSTIPVVFESSSVMGVQLLQSFISVVVMLLLLLSGDVETNPGPTTMLSMDKHLKHVKYAVWGARAQWKNIGRSLGLPEGTIQSIHEPDEGECLHAVLSLWMQTGQATINDLLEALENPPIARRDIAHEIRALRGKDRINIGLEPDTDNPQPQGLDIDLVDNTTRLAVASADSTQVKSTSIGSPTFLPVTESPQSYRTIEKVVIQPPPTPPKDPKIVVLENTLYNELITYRNQLAHELGIAPFMVAANKLLGELAKARPSSEAILKQIEGVSDDWFAKYGDKMLKVIGEFCHKNGGDIPTCMDTLPQKEVQPKEKLMKIRLVKRTRNCYMLTDTQKASYELFTENNMCIEDIANKRTLSPGTIMGHMADALEAGYFVDYRRAGLTEEIEDKVVGVIRKKPICSDISSLGSIMRQVQQTVDQEGIITDYGQLKLAVAVIVVKTGFERKGKPGLTHSLSSPPAVTPSVSVHVPYCTEPVSVDVSQSHVYVPGAAGALVSTDKLWRGRNLLKVYFLNPHILGRDGRLSVSTILACAQQWNSRAFSDVPNFERTDSTWNADIRVYFGGSGCWSMVGTDARTVFDKTKPTMNLALNGLDPDFQKFLVIHEFGHALGLEHEHQRSEFWKVLSKFVDVTRMKFDSRLKSVYFDVDMDFVRRGDQLSSEYDPDSVMHYWFDVNWLKSENHRTLEGVWGDNSLTRLEKKILEGIHKRNKSFRVDGPSRTDLYFLQKCYQDGARFPSGSDIADTSELVEPITISNVELSPEDGKISVGKSASLTVEVAGTSPTYKWFRNDSEEPLTDSAVYKGTTTATLHIEGATTELSGNYWCEVSNEISPKEKSSSVHLDVIEKPVFVEKSEDRIVKLGESVVLTVTAKGRDMEFNWIKHGDHPDDDITINPDNDQNYETESQTDSDQNVIFKLVIKTATVNMTRNYSCTISNLGGTVSPPPRVCLTVIKPPVITEHPVDKTAAEGNAVTFSIKAEGTNLKYEWWRNKTILKEVDHYRGVTTPRLSFTNARIEQSGQYYCVVSNKGGSVSSEHAKLVIIGGFENLSSDQILKLVDDVTIEPRPGVEKVAQSSVMITSSKGSYRWTDHGFSLQIPQDSLPPNVPECQLSISSSLSGQYQFPDNSELVSAIYWIRCIPHVPRFERPLTVKLEHCAKTTSSSKLNFVKAVHSQNSGLYTFEQLEECGSFSDHSRYGLLQLDHFCAIAITGKEVEKFYTASLYYQIQDPFSRLIDFVVVHDLSTNRTEVQKLYKDAKRGAETNVVFIADEISLAIPKEGFSINEWQLKPRVIPTTLSKKRIDNFQEGRKIPACQLEVALSSEWNQPIERCSRSLSLEGVNIEEISIELDPFVPEARGMMSFSVRMTCDDVCWWLKQNSVSEKDVQKFKDEEIDGAAFIELPCDQGQLKEELKLTCGGANKIAKLLLSEEVQPHTPGPDHEEEKDSRKWRRQSHDSDSPSSYSTNRMSLRNPATAPRDTAKSDFIFSPTKVIGLSHCPSFVEKWKLNQIHKKGLTGQGIKIAIIDTGIFSNHDVFKDKLSQLNGKNFVDGQPDDAWRTYPDNHGTAVVYFALEIAPEANIYVLRVAQRGDSAWDPSNITKALDFLISEQPQFGVDIVSMSFGTTSGSLHLEWERRIDELSSLGIICVAAAGNEGGFQKDIAVPACFGKVLSVGSINENSGDPSGFNPKSREIQVFAFGQDLLAPAVALRDDQPLNRGIIQSVGETDAIANDHPPLELKTDLTSIVHGTSMATPMIAGLIALLFQRADFLRNSKCKGIRNVSVVRKLLVQHMQSSPEKFILEPFEFFVNKDFLTLLQQVDN